MKYLNTIQYLSLLASSFYLVRGETDAEITEKVSSIFESKDAMKEYFDAGEAVYSPFFKAINKYADSLEFSLTDCESNCLKAQEEHVQLVESPEAKYKLEHENEIRKLYKLNEITVTSAYDHCMKTCKNLEFLFRNINQSELYVTDNDVEAAKTETKEKRKEMVSDLTKRADVCATIEDKGVDEYQAHNYVITIDDINKDKNVLYSRIDGCSVPDFVKNDAPDFPMEAITIFETACNYHDACYHCSEEQEYAKDNCDANFYSFMQGICDQRKKAGLFSSFEDCVNDAYLMYTAVKLYGHNSFRKNHDVIESKKKSAGKEADCICTERDVQTLLTNHFHFTIRSDADSGKSSTSTSSASESSNGSTMKVSTNGRCGPKFSTKCPAGQCCSKDGYCGTTPSYCSVSKGCQIAYGDCKCGNKDGYEFGKCGDGYCCSSLNFCGKTTAHCYSSKGCLPEFGDCRCGSGYGKCAGGFCCSNLKYCGTTARHCSASKGCQIAYGDCRCGSEFGNCPSGNCCSQYNYCGTKNAYCSSSLGCQSNYGKQCT